MALIKHGNNALSNVTALPSAIPTGKPVLLSTATASSSSSIEFTSGIDSAYDIYQFEFNSIHPANDGVEFNFNISSDGGSNYNVTKTTTFFNAFHSEADTSSGLLYNAGQDLAQSTGVQNLSGAVGNGNDESAAGKLFLINTSSNTYVKHFIAEIVNYNSGNEIEQKFIAGYGNTTSAVNAIQFKFSSGNIDAGTIKMYGISA